MSTRKVRKVRHFKPAPTFAECVKNSGVKDAYLALWKNHEFDTTNWGGAVDGGSALSKFLKLRAAPHASTVSDHDHSHHNHNH